MSRSLLPSTDRRSARKHRAGIHRQARRTTRLQVARFERDPEAFDDAAGWEREPDQGIRSMVCDRRRADKVSPFIRWATAATRELPWESRRSHIQGLLPKGVIGEHALFHLRHARAFEEPFWREHRQAFTKLASRRRWMERGEQAELLRALLAAPGGHRAFNGWLRARHATWYNKRGEPMGTGLVRMLLGMHDVLPFLAKAETYDPFHGRSTLFYATQAFLHAFKEHRGHLEATLTVLGCKGGQWRPAGVPSSRATSERRRRLSSSRGGPAGVEIPRPAEHGA